MLVIVADRDLNLPTASAVYEVRGRIIFASPNNALRQPPVVPDDIHIGDKSPRMTVSQYSQPTILDMENLYQALVLCAIPSDGTFHVLETFISYLDYAKSIYVWEAEGKST
jgi:hypothetical protein